MKLYALAALVLFALRSPVDASASPHPWVQKGRKEAQGDAKAEEGKVLGSDAVPQEQGVLGTEYPLVQAVIRADAPLHEDTMGTAPRELLDLAGAPGGGFAAVWQDHRDGNMGLYFARVGADGKTKEAERPTYSAARASRELDPSISVNGSGAGVVSWREKSMPNGLYFTRLFDASGKTSPAHLPMGVEFPAGGSRGAGAELVMPSVAVLPDGSGVCVWLAANRAMLQVIRATGPTVEQPIELSRAEAPATARPVIGAALDGTLLVAWGTQAGIECSVRPARGRESRGALGAGKPLELHSDRQGGWWIFVEAEGKRVLRHADNAGKVDREVNAFADRDVVDVAVADFGLLVLLGPAPLGAGGRDGGREPARAGGHQLALVPFEPGAGVAEAPQPIALRSETGEMLGNVRIAAAGAVGLVAWRERRGGDQVLVARTIEAGGKLGKPEDLTHDRGTSNQTGPDVASNGEDRAVAAWMDRRNGENEIWVRVLDAEHGFASPEFPVPVRVPGEAVPTESISGGQPAVAMTKDSRFAVAWVDTSSGGAAVFVQGFSAEVKPLAAAVRIDACSKDVGTLALVTAEDGYVLVWRRAEGGVAARRVDFACLPLGKIEVLTTDKSAGNVTACRLDVTPREREKRACAVAWDVAIAGVGRRLRARVLGSGLKLAERELSFDTMFQGSDWDPAIAPLDDGGFVMIWVTGETRTRDVFARGFDSDGKPRSQPHAVSARANEQDYPEIARLGDGSIALVWEDDISLWDYVNVRRFSADLKKLGPPLQLCERPEEFMRSHTHAKVAAFGDGFVSVWTDTRRGTGADVYWKLVGPRFDTRVGGRK
ncbi:MAG: hypothetical protein HZA52_14725 [Planctomycetes bacterium]|nr:hypothetical protein [Planctomycetota bacterium]